MKFSPLIALSFAATQILCSDIFTLHTSYEKALESNPVYKASYHKSLADKERKNQALAGLLPTLVVSGQKNESFNNSATYHTSTPYNPATSRYGTDTWELKLTQPLFRVQNYLQFSSAKISNKAAEAELAMQHQQLITKVAEAYFGLLSASDNKELAYKKALTLKVQLNDVKKRFQLGDATITDLKDTEAKYSIAYSQYTEASLQSDVAVELFIQVVGEKPEKIENISHFKNFTPPSPDNQDLWVEQAQTSNVALVHKKFMSQMAHNEVLSKKSEYLPTVDVVGSSMYYDTKGGINGLAYTSHQNYIGLQLVAPLYQGGMTSSKVEESVQRYTQALQEQENALRESRYNTIKEFKAVKASFSKIKSLEVALQSSQKNMDATRVGYSLGVKTHYELLQSIEQYYQVKKEFLNEKYVYLLGTLRLKMHVGSLTANDLKFMQ